MGWFSFAKKTQPVDVFAFPAGPDFVPDGLTKATPKYRRHAIIAMLSLAGFVLLYLALMGWFAWTSYLIFSHVMEFPEYRWLVAIAGACSAFLALFMAKGLVFVQKGAASQDLELKRKDHPRLFRFLDTLANDAGAPKPHRVFLSPRVNAAVFYDLTLLDLFFPSRKNLEIGLGLVNVLTLGELKAVLAHEFGHFAQKSMAVGRWVYVAQQVATHIVNKRDALDTFLSGLSRFDFRVAWIGWTLQFSIWSLRSLTDTLLSGVILAQRALSREMEFQADLVSVSLCGSDAIVTSLHRLSGADDAMDRAMNFAASEQANGTPVKDVFAIQTRVLEHLRSIYDDPHYGAAPAPSEISPEHHRVFKSDVAAPPRMWSTHPANSDRENNAKSVYVRCQCDDRSAWELFPDADALRAEMTNHAFAAPAADAKDVPLAPVPIEESIARLDDNYASITIAKRYRGAYMGRSIARGFRNAADMIGDVAKGGDPKTRIAALYPQSLGEAFEKLRELFEEKNTFEGVQKGYLQAPGGVVRWRGEEVMPRQLPKILKALDGEIEPVKTEIANHDREVRAAHAAAARAIGGGWEAYHQGLVSLIHYVEHTHADCADLHGVLLNVYAVVTADRKVSEKELTRLIKAANDLRGALERIYNQADDVIPDERTTKRAGMTTYKEALGEFKLPIATAENIGQWLSVVDGWVGGTNGTLLAVRSCALQELLLCEDELAKAVASGQKLADAPKTAALPDKYPRLMFDENRPRQTKLNWWDRFQTADGWFAATARFTTAFVVVGAVILIGALLAFPGLTEQLQENGRVLFPYEPTPLPPQ
jgi:Zn-dependent protease with chaperone function